jgi:hypothetical protein
MRNTKGNKTNTVSLEARERNREREIVCEYVREGFEV